MGPAGPALGEGQFHVADSAQTILLLLGRQLLPRWGNLPGLTMKVIVDLCVVPIGVGVHLAPYIATCEKVLTEAGLKIQLHPNGTAIEGAWEPVFQAIEACHQAVHAMGCPRIYTTVKINTRTDKDQTLEDKVASVQALL